MYNPESVLENETHKIIILAKQADLVIANRRKRTCLIVDCAVSADHRVMLKEYEKRY